MTDQPAPTPIRSVERDDPKEAARRLLASAHKEVVDRLTRNRAEIARLQAEVRDDVLLEADLARTLTPFSKPKRSKSTTSSPHKES